MPESCDVVLGISGELWVRRHSSSKGDGSSPARKAAAGLALARR